MKKNKLLNRFGVLLAQAKWHKKLLAISILFAFASSGFAQQVSTYTFAQANETYVANTGGTTILAAGTDDASSAATSIGFSFVLAGTTYTQFVANSNGSIRLGAAGPSSQYTPISTTSNAGGIALFARDGRTGGAVTYLLSGAPGSQVLTIEYPTFNLTYTTAATTATGQIKLYEGTNEIKFVYNGFTAAAAYTCQVGIRASSTDFANRTTTSDWSATTSGIASNTMALSAAVGPASGQSYTWTPPLPCAGTPAPGNVTGPTGACSGVAFTLGLQNTTIGTGVSYLWESADDAAFTVNVATIGAAATASTNILAAKYFRCSVTCTGVTTITNSHYVTLNPINDCYCVPTTTFGCTDGDVIARVVLNTLGNVSGTGCPSGTLGYSDYTDSAAANYTTTLQAGNTYNCLVSAGQYAESYAAWIDYNDNGVFDHPAERIGFTASPVAGSGSVGVLGSTASFPITLACNPPLGQHRLRVRAMYNIAGSAMTPCANNSYGEIEDYIITINAAVACPAPSAFAATPTPGGADLSWTLGCAESNWNVHITTVGGGAPTGAPSNPGVTNDSISITGLDPATSYDAYVIADCEATVSGAGASLWVGPITFTTGATCFPPTSLIVTNITATDAEVNFTSPVAGSPAGYEYYVSTSPVSPTAATPGTAISGPGATQTTLGNALANNTAYYVWVRSNCGLMPVSGNPNNSDWSFSSSFTTLNIPCSGTPAPGTLSPGTACAGQSVTLSSSNATSGLLVTYQWYSWDGTTATAIAGATSSTYATPAIVGGESYFLEVACDSLAYGYSDTVSLGLNPFENCYCTANLHTSSGPCIEEVSFNTLLNNTAAAACALPAYSQTPAGTVTTSVEQGQSFLFKRAATFAGAWTGLWIDYDHSGTFDASEYTLVVSASSSTIYDSVMVTIPYGALTGSTGMRVRQRTVDMTSGDACTQNFGSGETEDYVISITAAPFCTGTPAPGNTIAPAAVCAGSTVIMSLQNLTIGSGVTFQWFDAATNTAILGANSDTYTSGPIVGGEQFYCQVTCTAGSTMGQSSTVTIGLSPFYDCYCVSTATSTGDEEIFGVSLTSTLGTAAQTSTCASTGGAGSVLNQYSNYKGNTPLDAKVGSNVSFTIDLNACGSGAYDNGTAVWIDFNQNGSFADAGEQVFVEASLVTTTPGVGRVLTGSFVISPSALTGVTGVRVINSEGNAGIDLDPCLTYSWGETEDYLINILPATSVDLTVTMFIEGYYDATSAPAAMFPALYNNDQLNGGSTYAANAVDSVTIELVDATYATVYSANGLLLTDGTVDVSFPLAALSSAYFIRAIHKNSLNLWSSALVTMNPTTAYNFSTSLSSAATDGSNAPMSTLAAGLYGLYSGDLNKDGFIDNFDYPNFTSDLDDSAYNFLFFLTSDLNGDGFVDSFDYPMYSFNNGLGVYEQYP